MSTGPTVTVAVRTPVVGSVDRLAARQPVRRMLIVDMLTVWSPTLRPSAAVRHTRRHPPRIDTPSLFGS
jgi:hypothetical protein